MLKIRKEQMETLAHHMMSKYEQRVMRKIARTFPERYKKDGHEKMLLFIQAGILKAEKYAIDEDDDVELFILLLVQYGMDFEKKPEMSRCRKILVDEDLPADAKVTLLCNELDFDPKDVKQKQNRGGI